MALHQTTDIHEAPYALCSEVATRELQFYRRFLDRCAGDGPRGVILDVGCGTGEFLKLAADRGFAVVGIEPVGECRAAAEQKVPKARVDARPVEEATFENGSLHAVTMWDVIEHLVDPRGALALVHEWLRPGGYLAIATINHRSLMYAVYHLLRRTVPPIARPFGVRLYNPYHTYYFTKQSLRDVVERVGFEVLEQHGYEFPLGRLDIGVALKVGMRMLYGVQWVCGMEGEQYLFARKH